MTLAKGQRSLLALLAANVLSTSDKACAWQHFRNSRLSRSVTQRRVLATRPLYLEKKPLQRWVTCTSTNEMIHAVSTLIRPDDVVAEIGSQLREVSTNICENLRNGGGHAILMDVERKAPKNSNNAGRTKAMRYPGEEE